jgi:hypothetical protein
VQTLLEVGNDEDAIKMVLELQPFTLQCVKDLHGNHCISKCLERIIVDSGTGGGEIREEKKKGGENGEERGMSVSFASSVAPLIREIAGKAVMLSQHPCGCRCVQRLLNLYSYCSTPDTTTTNITNNNRSSKDVIWWWWRQAATSISKSAVILSTHRYGNYVVQHLLSMKLEPWTSAIVENIRWKVLVLGRDKHASNVVERCLTGAGKEGEEGMVRAMVALMEEESGGGGGGGNEKKEEKGEGFLQLAMDAYGNFVVQKLLRIVVNNSSSIREEGSSSMKEGSEYYIQVKENLLTFFLPRLDRMKMNVSGRQVAGRIENIVNIDENKNKEEEEEEVSQHA